MKIIPEEIWEEIPDPIFHDIAQTLQRQEDLENDFMIHLGKSDELAIKFAGFNRTTQDENAENKTLFSNQIEHLRCLETILQRVDNPHFAVDVLEILEALTDFAFLLQSLDVTRDRGNEVFEHPGQIADALGNVKMISRHQSRPEDLELLGEGLLRVIQNFRDHISLSDQVDDEIHSFSLDDEDEICSTSFLAARRKISSLRREIAEESRQCDFLQRLLDQERSRRVELGEAYTVLQAKYKAAQILQAYGRSNPLKTTSEHERESVTTDSVLITDSDDKQIRTRNSNALSENSQRNGLSFEEDE